MILENFKSVLMALNNVTELDFDMDCYNESHQFILLVKYDIPVSDSRYFDKKWKLMIEVNVKASDFGLLLRTPIEDRGTWLYFVYADCRYQTRSFIKD